MIMIDLVTGSKFSQWKLLYQTNCFFLNRGKMFIPQRRITNENFVLTIGKKKVKILMAEKITLDEFKVIKNYIESMFRYKSIGVYLEKDISWINDIENVRVHKYIYEKKDEGEYYDKKISRVIG